MHGEFIIFNDEDENGKVPGLRCQVSGARSQEKQNQFHFIFTGFPDT